MTVIPVFAGRQAPGGWLCDVTIALAGPVGAVKAPVKPAPFQALRAFATVRPTMFGTVWQAGCGVGVGAGVGVGGGVGVGVGGGVACGGAVGVGVGLAVGGAGVASGASVGVAAGRDVDPGAPAGWRAGSVAAGSLVAGATEAPPASEVPVAVGSEASTDDGADGVSVASRTPCTPPAWNGFPRSRANTAATRTTTPMPAGTRWVRKRRTAWRVAPAATGPTTVAWGVPPPAAVRVSIAGATAALEVAIGVAAARASAAATAVAATGAAAAAATTSGAYLIPHSGQPSAASSQHQRHAKMSQAGQWHRPTHGPIAAGSTDVPQRSQKGSGAPPGSRAPCLAELRAASFRGGSVASDKDRWPG